jgi:site-specific recombinase XerD
MNATPLPALIEGFFSERLGQECAASPNTITSYRDTFRLLFQFAQKQLNKAPSKLSLEDLEASFVGKFLDHLEEERGNSPRTRNARLAAIHSFFRYAALKEPQHSALIQCVLAIPTKRYETKPVEFLHRTEVEALLAAPDLATWTGRRDRAMLLLAVQTGVRVSELVGLRCQDLVLGSSAHLCCHGKGRKQRCIPLTKSVARILRAWLAERQACPSDPLLPNARGEALSRSGVSYLLDKNLVVARENCPTLAAKRISPHVLRHTAAMDLLHSEVDCTVIALWLGHESVKTTQIYLHSDLELKEKALAKTTPLGVLLGRYRPDDPLMAYLQAL